MNLPPLRDELLLFDAAPDKDGSPCWMIQDPVVNRFYRIGWMEFEFLSRWSERDSISIIQRVLHETPLRPTLDDLAHFLAFLAGNQLLRVGGKAGIEHLKSIAKSRDTSFFVWLVQHYLFFKVPLIYPNEFLNRAMPYLRWVFSPVVIFIFLLVSASGLFLVTREIDVFIRTFTDSLTWRGVAGYFIAISLSKSIHEFGHMLSAKRYGVKIPHAGIAFMVFLPILYTDTNESWKLKDSRKRLLIASGGVIVEFILAGIVSFLWGISPDGHFRNMLFSIAFVSLLMSLFININPFMRFDGYYILSDLLDIQNMQPRSFILAKVFLRRHILGINEPYPEVFSSKLFKILLLYAFFTWIYRFFIFIGIAVIVYYIFFKPLGIFLMIVEVWYFIASPIAAELSKWHSKRRFMPKKRKYILAAVVLLIVALLSIPSKREIKADAVMVAKEKRMIFSPFPARTTFAIQNESAVKKGDILFKFDIDYYAFMLRQTRVQIESLQDRIKRFSPQEKEREAIASLREKLLQKEKEYDGYMSELERLEITADFDAVISDVSEYIQSGVYVSNKDLLGILINPNSFELEAFIDEKYLGRIKTGARVRFYSSIGDYAPIFGTIKSIDETQISILPYPLLAKKHGGRINTQPEMVILAPLGALYRVQISLDKQPKMIQMQYGTAFIEAEGRSRIADMMRFVISIFIRESGF